jgi:hypothetical protein
MVVAVVVTLIPCPTARVTVTPVPVVVIIVVTMTRTDIHATRTNLYADVGPRRSGLWSRDAYEGNCRCAEEK